MLSNLPNIPIPHHLMQNAAALLLNHLLAQEPNLSSLLKRHTASVVALHLPPPFTQPFAFRIAADGLLDGVAVGTDETMVAAATAAAPSVKITLQPGFIAAAAEDKLRFIRLEGDALLAQDLATLAQHLRWDAARDLAKFLPPSMAYALVDNAKLVAAQLKTLVERLRANVREYQQHENPGA